jgi:hypothetical protein
MAEFTIELTSTSSVTPVEGRSIAEHGFLSSICYDTPGAEIGMGRLWLELGVKSGGIADEMKVAVLFSGYVSRNRKQLWDGSFPLKPYDQIYAKAKSTVQVLLRFRGRITEVYL